MLGREQGVSECPVPHQRRHEFETIDQAREEIDRYIDRYHHRPHSRLAYRTPREVAATWKHHDDHAIPAA